jgi:tRNA U38,U39,U40 pseudouridine synthase TruA
MLLDVPDPVTRLNELLPAQIRVLGMIRCFDDFQMMLINVHVKQLIL